ncbi:MAG: hypothetical protein ACYTFT_16675 [Planctomycetota bacterium]|jgi:hypothetical protein
MLQTLARIAQIGFLVVITGIGGWFLYGKLKSEPRRELDPYRRILVADVIEEVVSEIPRRDEIRKLAVAPVARDVDGRVFDLLYDELGEAGLYFLADDDATLEAAKDAGAPTTIEAAVNFGRRLKADDPSIEGVLFTRLGEFSDGRKGVGARVGMDAWLLNLQSGATAPGGVIHKADSLDSRTDLRHFAAFSETVSPLLRVFLWALFVAALPFALLPVVKGVLKRRNTQRNLVLVAGFALASVLVALVLMGLRPGWTGVLLLFVGLLGSVIYSIAMFEQIEKAG